jgi:hypothetical protein
LTATDARRVEDAFESKLAAFGSGNADMIAPPTSVAQSGRPALLLRPRAAAPNEGPDSSGVDKSLLTVPEPRRIRDKDHVRFVARQPCVICGRQPSDAHHLRFAQLRALGRKVSDEFTVPLCRGHHREVHRCDDEAAWWKKAGIDPIGLARALWLKTHPLPGSPDKSIDRATTVASVDSNPKNAAGDRPVRRRGPNYKTKPILAARPQ